MFHQSGLVLRPDEAILVNLPPSPSLPLPGVVIALSFLSGIDKGNTRLRAIE